MYSLVGENASSRRSPVPEASAVLEDLASVYAEARPRSRAAFDRARRVLPGGLTHEVRHLPPFLPYIVKAAGARKWDADGYEYVDLAMGHGASSSDTPTRPWWTRWRSRCASGPIRARTTCWRWSGRRGSAAWCRAPSSFGSPTRG